MNEDFVSYELAVRLKEKGFNRPCCGYYHVGKGDDSFEACISSDFLNSLNEYRVGAPTISQVLKWLREEKLILIGLSPMQEYGGDEVIEWCSTVYKADKQGGLSWKEEFYYQSYEQAALAGIEYVLDNLNWYEEQN